jgi:predicted Rossmann-fold nucleotide-binding protein
MTRFFDCVYCGSARDQARNCRSAKAVGHWIGQRGGSWSMAADSGLMGVVANATQALAAASSG